METNSVATRLIEGCNSPNTSPNAILTPVGVLKKMGVQASTEVGNEAAASSAMGEVGTSDHRPESKQV